ncbi:sigma-70 family RNA polymerase sigma factor [Sandarakinorhabdus sp. AAP62]|uniref:sigma-70 family RNA polymerase sigma factor n=1 Tax=Sandarakinorhabdus sp. AAP62 TaxID=1248916 RepID=UPI0002F8F5EA|nr:sigma-70 family RNA polymerase sigma factor [Sandarakinorhabdus sp. AAP62]
MNRPVQPVTPGAAELSSLLLKAADGDTAAFHAFYDRTSAKLFGVILRILVERQESEDVLQDVYLSIWRKAATFDPSKASPITWAATIARNRAIDRLRARPPRAQVPVEAAFELADDGPAQDAGLIHGDDVRRLTAALASLEPRHAAAIRACYFDGVTYDELAEREQVPVGTLKSWVRRGLIRMRGALEGSEA